MGEGNIQDLNIQISADAKKAEKSLNSFVKTMDKVNSAFGKMNSGGIRKFSKEIGSLTSSLRSLNSIKISTPQISGLSSELKKLSRIDASKINATVSPLRELSYALKSFDGIGNLKIPEINTKNLSSVAKVSKKFSEIETGNMNKVADGLKNISESMNLLSSLNLNNNGLNKVINSLNRLFKADFSKFNPSDFQSIADSIGNLGKIPDISSNINRFVASLARLSNAGSKISIVSKELPGLSSALKKSIQQISKTSGISESINLFVQSIGRLASAGSKTNQTASGLKNLADETIKFFQAMQKAPKISENTVRMTQALAQLASAGGKVGTATNTVTSAFNKLSQIGTKTMSVLKKAASGIASAFKQIGNSSSSVKTAQFNLLSLAKTAIAFRIGYGFLEFGKQAFQLGSDITEVENVVNVAFGNMSQYAYDFAKTAKEQFGLSELVALKYAGTMKSVLNSSGVANEAAAEMSTTLTGLAGDLASFYNISQDDAWTKIMAGMAGEIEPLRRLGINLSVANLQAYALSQGITKSWQSMTQAEQVMLRYNYLMQVTAAQQGDFARTSGKLCAA